MSEVVVLFDGTSQEPDLPYGQRTNIFRFGMRWRDVVLYEPGIATRSEGVGKLTRWAAASLGLGLNQRVDDMLDRLEFFRGARVSVVGGSRGAAQALEFCLQYEARYDARVRFCGLFDCCRATHVGALKRVLPRRLWGGRKVFARPPADVVVHAMAGREPSRLYAHDEVQNVDEEWTYDNLEHGEVLRHGAPRAWMEECAERAGLPMCAPRRSPRSPAPVDIVKT